jgi:hypothetical protein|tara:strand:- start:1987 stop:2229 length:243 start_codon:yes stop_codon:yes gene_type:complete
MHKKDVLLFIKERHEALSKMKASQFAGRITREEQALYQEAWSYIDPKAKVCFSCGRSPQIMSVALLNYYEANKPKRRKKK